MSSAGRCRYDDAIHSGEHCFRSAQSAFNLPIFGARNREG